eukprot:NODE_593_length_6321_cov_0.361299.p1 type:complete len:447 gc:universal NODE_593_length_6321_cov_0.361299:4150-5490(+)
MFVQPGYHHFLFQDDVDFVIKMDDIDALCCVELMKSICKNYSISKFANYIPQQRTVLGINMNSPFNKNKERIRLSFTLNPEDVYDDSTIVLVDNMTNPNNHRNVIPTWCAFKMLETLNILELKHAHWTSMIIYFYFMNNLIDYDEYLSHIKDIQLIFPSIILHEHLYGYLFGSSSLFNCLRYTPHLFYLLKWHKNEQLARHLTAHAGISLNYSKSSTSTDMSLIYKFINKAESFSIENKYLLIHCIQCDKLRNMDMALYSIVLLDHPWLCSDVLHSLNSVNQKSILLMQVYLQMICHSFGLMLQQKLLRLLPLRQSTTLKNCDACYAILDHLQIVTTESHLEQIGPFGLRWLSSVLSNIYDVPVLLAAPFKDDVNMIVVLSDPTNRVKDYYENGSVYDIVRPLYIKEPIGPGMYMMDNRQDTMDFIEGFASRLRAYAVQEDEEIEE